MRSYGLVLVAMGLAVCGATPAARAAEPKISDQAGFFSKDAVDSATQKLADINRRYKVQVVIETFAAIPDDKKADYKPENKADFFKHWAETRATDQGVKGIYLLVCKDPHYLYMEPDKAVRKKAFTLEDRTALVTKFRKLLGQKQFDDALKETVDSIETTLQANLPSLPANK